MANILLKTIYFFSFWSLFSACSGSKIVKGTVKPVSGSSTTTSSNKVDKKNSGISNTKTKSSTYSDKLGIDIPKNADQELVNTIASWMGVPYKFGGIDKKGVDCSGFINNVVREVYRLQIPRMTSQIYETAKPISKKDLQEGDIVFFKISSVKVSHAGIYLYDGYFAHASTSKGVMISRLDEAYWKKYYVGSGRLNR